MFDKTFNLSTLNGNNGFNISGLTVSDQFGFSVSSAGDINGDGKADLIIGANNRNSSGAAYVIFGQLTGFTSSFNLNNLNGSNGFTVSGLAVNSELGFSVSTAGDINGDGKDDVIIGAFGVSFNRGAVYVIFGQATNFNSFFNLATLDGSNGFTVSGLVSGDDLGYSVSTAGDINGDGKSDFLIGATGANSNKGAVYVIFGQSSGFNTSFDLTALNGNNGFLIPGLASNDYLGNSVSTAGDINGDGKSDLLIGAQGTGSNEGAVYVIFGQSNGFNASFDLTALNGSNGFLIPGLASNTYLGNSVSTAGDINGDGKSDLIIGALGTNSYKGAIYVLLGKLNAFNSSFDLTTLNGNNGFNVSGLVSGDQLGTFVRSAGDINEDGKSDIIIGAYAANSAEGASYIIFGQGSGFASSLDLTTLNGSNGFTVSGLAPNNYLGQSVNSAGDVNCDGKADLIIGAWGASSNTGAAYVIFGESAAFLPAPTDLTTLNGRNGFTVPGLTSGDQLGISFNFAGDINGDGKTDLIIGASGVNSNAGAAYVIFGQDSGFNPSFNLTTLNGRNGFTVPGLASGDYLGYSVGAGDINGDGKSDLIIGAFYVSSDKGAAYVIFGHTNSFNSTFDLNSLNGSNGFEISGLASNDYLGNSVSSTGDINGDGKDDLVIGAYITDSAEGAVYVIFGQASGFSASFNLTTLNGINGFKVLGNDHLGAIVSSAGDMNGDGKDDLIIGTSYISSTTGAAYVIFGQSDGFPAFFDLNSLNGNNGFSVSGLAVNDQLGFSISAAGDINCDGKDDLIVGAWRANSLTGAAYVIFGQSSGFSASFNLSSLNGNNGFSVSGLVVGDQLGSFVSSASDINSDGKADLIIGAYAVNSFKGAVYAIFGQAGGFNSSFNLNNLNGSNGFTILGLAVDSLGFSVSAADAAGDINGDGKDDLIIGAYGANSGSGIAYVIFGQTEAVASLPMPIFMPVPTPALPMPTSLFPFTPPLMPLPTPTIITPAQMNHAPIVVHPIADQTVEVNRPFNFSIPSNTFSDPDGDILIYSAQQADNAPLPTWVYFDELTRTFIGDAPLTGINYWSVFATDPYHASVGLNLSLTVVTDTPVLPVEATSPLGAVVGGIVGGILGFGALMGMGYGLYKKFKPVPLPSNAPDSLDIDNPNDSAKMLQIKSMVDDGRDQVKPHWPL